MSPVFLGKDSCHSHGNDHVPLNEGEKLRAGGPDKAGKRQPELRSALKNGKGNKQGNAERIFNTRDEIQIMQRLPPSRTSPDDSKKLSR